MLTRRMRRPRFPCWGRHGAFSLWHRYVPERCAETVRGAAYWGDGRKGFAIAVIATSTMCCSSHGTFVRLLLFEAEVALALAAEFSEPVCGGGRISGGVLGSGASIEGPAIGGYRRSMHVRVPPCIPAKSTYVPVVMRAEFPVPR